jgi:hypothetical protein
MAIDLTGTWDLFSAAPSVKDGAQAFVGQPLVAPTPQPTDPAPSFRITLRPSGQNSYVGTIDPTSYSVQPGYSYAYAATVAPNPGGGDVMSMFGTISPDDWIHPGCPSSVMCGIAWSDGSSLPPVVFGICYAGDRDGARFTLRYNAAASLAQKSSGDVI